MATDRTAVFHLSSQGDGNALHDGLLQYLSPRASVMTARVPPRLEVVGCKATKGFFGKAILAPTQDMRYWIWLMAIHEEALKQTWEAFVPDRPFDRQYMIDVALMKAEDMEFDDEL